MEVAKEESVTEKTEEEYKDTDVTTKATETDDYESVVNIAFVTRRATIEKKIGHAISELAETFFNNSKASCTHCSSDGIPLF